MILRIVRSSSTTSTRAAPIAATIRLRQFVGQSLSFERTSSADLYVPSGTFASNHAFSPAVNSGVCACLQKLSARDRVLHVVPEVRVELRGIGFGRSRRLRGGGGRCRRRRRRFPISPARG